MPDKLMIEKKRLPEIVISEIVHTNNELLLFGRNILYC